MKRLAVIPGERAKMVTRKLQRWSGRFAVAAILLSATFAHAALTISLAPATQNAALGSELVFSGTLSNTSATDSVFLNDIQATLSGTASGYTTFNSNTFFANVPGILLPGETYAGAIFGVMLGSSAPAGDYAGTITITGSADIFAANNLCSANFAVLSPALTIVASVPDASEFGPVSGSFTISRTGRTDTNLAVQFTIAGTATNGVTYSSVPASATISSGLSSVAITIAPIPDSIAQGDRSATFTLTSSTNCNLGSPVSGTVTVHDKPADNWRFQKFGANANTPAAADSADWESDGIPNLIEYALNLEPKISDASSLPIPVVTNGYLTFSFIPNPSAIDLNYFVEASTDLIHWSADNVETVSLQNPRTFRYNQPVTLASRAFLRLRIERRSSP